MASVISNEEQLHNELKTKQICRFCLTQQVEKLSSIYQRDPRLKSSAPLPVQIMGCASIEVFSNDGMPSFVCSDCRLLFEHSYRFKQMCKRAETLLKQFPLTGQWPAALPKPKFPRELLCITTTPPSKLQPSQFHGKTETKSPQQKWPTNDIKTAEIATHVKILNSDPAKSPEPPIPTRMKKEKLDKETTNFLNKFDNDEELSMDDVQRLIEASNEEHELQLENENMSVSQPTTIQAQIQKSPAAKQKPKVLNKSSVRILNRDANIVVEPRFSAPQLKCDVDGKMAMVTEMLDPLATYEPEPDPVKDAAPIETIVFPCQHCERSFPLRQLRDIHMVNHTRNRSFQCPECEKSFFSKYDLQKHSLIHTGDRPFKCLVCEKAFTRATLLHRHEKTHTDIPKFICIYCEKPFISKEQMEKHAELHRKNRPFQCGVCQKSFAFKQGLERHEVVHSREQPYPCQYCEQGFSTPSKLARHLTAHAGKRPYPCKFCPKSYLLSHHLTRHLRSHKYETVGFICSDCDKVFKSRDELIYHSAVHAMQTLVCPLCKDSFSDIESVTEHIKEHAESDAFACEFCDLIFMTAERLQQHTDADHASDMAAYHEDDEHKKKILQMEAEKVKNVAEAASIDDNIVEETIEEFLVDEIQEVAENYVPDIDIKEENTWSNHTIQQPQILTKNVVQSKLNTNEGENYVVLDDEGIVENVNTLEEYDEQPSPAKIRRVHKTAERPLDTQTKRSPQLRPRTTTVVNKSATNIKKESEDVTSNTISSVLKMLPKDVSVRRKVPINATDGHQKTKSSPLSRSEEEESSPAVRRRIPSEESAKSAKKELSPIQGSSRRNQVAVKKSPAADTVVASKKQQITAERLADNAAKTTDEKKGKMQKITVTKEEAAALAKSGCVRRKDGSLLVSKLTKHQKNQ